MSELSVEADSVSSWITLLRNNQHELAELMKSCRTGRNRFSLLMLEIIKNLKYLECNLLSTLRQASEDSTTQPNYLHIKSRQEDFVQREKIRQAILNSIDKNLNRATRKKQTAETNNQLLSKEFDELNSKLSIFTGSDSSQTIQKAKRHKILVEQWKTKKGSMLSEISKIQEEIEKYHHSSQLHSQLVKSLNNQELTLNRIESKLYEDIRKLESEKISYANDQALDALKKELEHNRAKQISQESRLTRVTIKRERGISDRSVVKAKTSFSAFNNRFITSCKKGKPKFQSNAEYITALFSKQISDLVEITNRHRDIIDSSVEPHLKNITANLENDFLRFDVQKERIHQRSLERDIELSSISGQVVSFSELLADLEGEYQILLSENEKLSERFSEKTHTNEICTLQETNQKFDSFLKKANIIIDHYHSKLQEMFEENVPRKRANSMPPIRMWFGPGGESVRFCGDFSNKLEREGPFNLPSFINQNELSRNSSCSPIWAKSSPLNRQFAHEEEMPSSVRLRSIDPEELYNYQTEYEENNDSELRKLRFQRFKAGQKYFAKKEVFSGANQIPQALSHENETSDEQEPSETYHATEEMQIEESKPAVEVKIEMEDKFEVTERLNQELSKLHKIAMNINNRERSLRNSSPKNVAHKVVPPKMRKSMKFSKKANILDNEKQNAEGKKKKSQKQSENRESFSQNEEKEKPPKEECEQKSEGKKKKSQISPTSLHKKCENRESNKMRMDKAKRKHKLNHQFLPNMQISEADRLMNQSIISDGPINQSNYDDQLNFMTSDDFAADDVIEEAKPLSNCATKGSFENEEEEDKSTAQCDFTGEIIDDPFINICTPNPIIERREIIRPNSPTDEAHLTTMPKESDRAKSERHCMREKGSERRSVRVYRVEKRDFDTERRRLNEQERETILEQLPFSRRANSCKRYRNIENSSIMKKNPENILFAVKSITESTNVGQNFVLNKKGHLSPKRVSKTGPHYRFSIFNIKADKSEKKSKREVNSQRTFRKLK